MHTHLSAKRNCFCRFAGLLLSRFLHTHYLPTCPRLTLRALAATEKTGGHTHTHTNRLSTIPLAVEQVRVKSKRQDTSIMAWCIMIPYNDVRFQDLPSERRPPLTTNTNEWRGVTASHVCNLSCSSLYMQVETCV